MFNFFMLIALFVLQNHDADPVFVHDPRPRINRFRSRREPAELILPKFKVNSAIVL